MAGYPWENVYPYDRPPPGMRRRCYLSLCGLAAGSSIAGCTTIGDGGNSNGDGGGGDGAYRGTFRDSLTREGVEIRELTTDGGRVELVYAPGDLPDDGSEEAYETRVQETVETASRSFFDRVYGGWTVDRLDATVRIDGSVVATWRMDREWIERYLDGEYTREEMARRVEESVERHYETDASDGS